MFKVKYGDLYLYQNANLFTHRSDRAREYKKKESAEKWIVSNRGYIPDSILDNCEVVECNMAGGEW